MAPGRPNTRANYRRDVKVGTKTAQVVDLTLRDYVQTIVTVEIHRWLQRNKDNYDFNPYFSLSDARQGLEAVTKIYSRQTAPLKIDYS